MQGPLVAAAEQVPFIVALSAELANYFLFAFWARSLTTATCHLSEEKSRMSVILFVLFLR